MAGGNIEKTFLRRTKNRFSQHGVLITIKLWGTDLRFTKTGALNTLLFFRLNDIVRPRSGFELLCIF